jgi:hypothetical protein
MLALSLFIWVPARMLLVTFSGSVELSGSWANRWLPKNPSVLCIQLDTFLRALWIIGAYPPCIFSFQLSNITWLLIINMFAPRFFCRMTLSDHFFIFGHFFILGFAATQFGLHHRKRLGNLVIRYWFVFLAVCAALADGLPMTRSAELDPFKDSKQQMSYVAVELLFVVAWLAAGDRLVDREIYDKDGHTWVGKWGLLLYVSHYALFVSVRIEVAYTLLLAMIIPCARGLIAGYVASARAWWRRPKAQSVPEALGDSPDDAACP